MMTSYMKKNIIVYSIVVILISLIVVALFVDIDLKVFKISSIQSLLNKREDIIKAEQQLEQQEKIYNDAITKNNNEQTKFVSEKNKYNAISDETIAIIKEATTEENYNIEYMWIRLGNYAQMNNLTIQLAEPGNTITESSNTTTKGNTTNTSTNSNAKSTSNATSNTQTTSETEATTTTEDTSTQTSADTLFTIQVKGSYLDVSDFVFEVENDKELRFKLDNISMDYVAGTTIKAKFNVKNLIINK